jgi:hypothetical protein
MPLNHAGPTVDSQPEGWPSAVVDEDALALAIEHLLDLAEATWREIEAARGAALEEAA